VHGCPTDRVAARSRARGRVLTLAAALSVGIVATASPAMAKMTPVGVWHMDEGAGATQMRDSSGFGNHGKIGKVQTGLTGPDAFLGAAYRFTGSKGSINEVPSSPTLVPGSSAFIAQVYARFPKGPPGDSYDLIRKGFSSSSGGDFKLEILPGSNARCYFRGSTGKGDVKSSGSLADGRWHRIACVKTAGEVQVQVDGKTYRKSAKVGAITNGAKLAIGSKTASEDLFDGFLDEVSLWVDR
jgi:concanavalin A-like lectin/glucanase superfamily protein